MKLLISGVLGLSLTSLAACGGGGSGSGSVPVISTPPGPSTTPTAIVTLRSVAIDWSGAMKPTGKSAQSLRLGKSISAPIMAQVCQPLFPGEYCDPRSPVDPKATVMATEIIMPAPIPSPNATNAPVTYTVSQTQSIVFSAPAPGPLPSGDPLSLTPLPSTSPGIYSLSASFPDGTSGTKPLIVYAGFVIGCRRNSNGYIAGFNLDAGSYTTDISLADVYVKSPSCDSTTSFFDANDAGATMYFPHGASVLGDSLNAVDFSSVGTTTVNACTQLTSADIVGAPSVRPCVSNAFLVKTKAGFAKINMSKALSGSHDFLISFAYLATSTTTFAY